MMTAGIMSTPAVSIDGVIKSTGKVPSKEEVASWIDGMAGTATIPLAPAPGGCCSCGGKC